MIDNWDWIRPDHDDQEEEEETFMVDNQSNIIAYPALALRYRISLPHSIIKLCLYVQQ